MGLQIKPDSLKTLIRFNSVKAYEILLRQHVILVKIMSLKQLCDANIVKSERASAHFRNTIAIAGILHSILKEVQSCLLGHVSVGLVRFFKVKVLNFTCRNGVLVEPRDENVLCLFHKATCVGINQWNFGLAASLLHNVDLFAGFKLQLAQTLAEIIWFEVVLAVTARNLNPDR